MLRLTTNDYCLLFKRIAAHDEAAFREVFHAQTPILFSFLHRLLRSEETAKEVLQETFLRLWMHRDQLAGIANPEAWLHTVASNLAYTQLRKQVRSLIYLDTISKEPEGSDDFAFEFLEKKELQHLLHEAVNQLPAARQAIFKLSRWENLSRKEIAEKLQLSENTVRNQLAIANQQIQNFIRKKLNLAIPVSVLVLISTI